MPWRYVIMTLGCLANIIAYSDRSNLSLAIVPIQREYGLSEGDVGVALGGFFMGYIFTQVLGGYLAFHLGPKRVLIFAVAFWSAATILTPAAASCGLGMLVAARVAIGLGEGLCLSCCGCLEASATLSDIALAFSYFTWADSGGALVVCDIQGVGLCFTDPQIHTADGRGFGLGNLGQSGIDRFLKGYRHGPMARRLGLHARKRAVAAPAAPSELLFPSVIAPPDAKKPMTSIRVSLEEESDGAARGALAPLSEVDASERIAA